ncbi:SUMF1/EgtB/PvdO family nonheme iron enzyme [Candidatus Saganbacteria bacterium]|nr:SUMF1/EgtB/PvdO family nonheme iron enzyme [Candidatus Saganbacteria bacterium]
MTIRRVHLVFNPNNRVVPVRVEGGRVRSDVVSINTKPDERLAGVIGHYRGNLTPERAHEILRDRVQVDGSAREFDGDLLRIGVVQKAIQFNVDLGIKMITIPGDEFVFQGVRGVYHKAFRIAETEVTNGHFRFLLEREPKGLTRILGNPKGRLKYSLSKVDPQYKHEAEDCPMVGLCQTEWAVIAELLGKRLATELEWERAAAGKKGRVFSFGDKFDKNKVTFNGEGTRSVYAHRDAATPEGVLDLSGNVWEWTSSTWGDIDLSDPKNPRFSKIGEEKVIRGGSWGGFPDFLKASYRFRLPVEELGSAIGARFAEGGGGRYPYIR